MIFYKTVTCGNDFLHIDEEEYRILGAAGLSKSQVARRLCRRQEGAGADGVVFYNTRQGSDVTGFEIFNRDGSEAELSGNGMAGLSALLFFLNPAKQGRVVLDTKAGIKTHSLLHSDNNKFRIQVEIGCPDFGNRSFFPFLEENRRDYRFKDVAFYPVSVGNPHVVVLGEAVDANAGDIRDIPDIPEDVEQAGRMLEAADIFPFKTNVEFILHQGTEPVDYEQGENFKVYYYERGVGPTISSSTGSAAIFAVLREMNLNKGPLTINIPALGEKLKISGKNEIYIESCTEIVYKGVYLGS